MALAIFYSQKNIGFSDSDVDPEAILQRLKDAIYPIKPIPKEKDTESISSRLDELQPSLSSTPNNLAIPLLLERQLALN